MQNKQVFADSIESLQTVVNEFSNKKSELINEPTIFEIAGFPSRENVFSNFLKFYFDSRNNHGFGVKVLKALLLTIDGYKEYKDEYLKTRDVKREVTTENLKRIDLIIETSTFVVAIENKVYHVLNNDLEEYSNYLKNHYKKVLKIVLNLTEDNPEPNEYGFIFISYKTFLHNLEVAVPQVANVNRYEVFYSEFIQNLKNHFPDYMTEAQINFLIRNEENINKIKGLYTRSINYINSLSYEIFRQVEFDKNLWNEYREIPDVFEVHYKTENPVLKIACTVEISKIYIEVLTDDKYYSELKDFLDKKYDADIKPQSMKWLYVKEYQELWKLSVRDISRDISQLILWIEDFLRDYNHINPAK